MLTTLIFPAVIVAIMWGVMPLVQKEILKFTSIKNLVFLLGVLMTIVMLLMLIIWPNDAREAIKSALNPQKLGMLLTLAAMAGFASFLYMFTLKSHKDSLVPVIVAIVCTAPLFTLITTYSKTGKVVHPACVCGIVLTVIGIALIAYYT